MKIKLLSLFALFIVISLLLPSFEKKGESINIQLYEFPEVIEFLEENYTNGTMVVHYKSYEFHVVYNELTIWRQIGKEGVYMIPEIHEFRTRSQLVDFLSQYLAMSNN